MKKKNNKPGIEIKDNPFPPAILDAYPTNLRVDVNAETDIPTDEAAHQAKRWVDYNIK